jgi:spore photoproduct lyase
LISYFREKSSAIFELKTKTVNIKNVLKLEPARNIVISWSLSSSRIAREEERGAPSELERIDAARKVSESGFWVGFHFDPIIRCSGWEEDYEKTIMRLLEAVAPSKIAWISLGSLRFISFLKVVIKERFPGTKIIYDEFIKGKDGKIRYFRPIRLELYRKIVSFIKRRGEERIPLYFCMETGDFWRDVMGWVPARGEDLGSHLAFSLDQSRR